MTTAMQANGDDCGTAAFEIKCKNGATDCRLESVRKAFAASPLYKKAGAIKAGGFEAAEAKGGRIAARLIGNKIGLARTEAEGSPSKLLDRLK